jgi:hypothetical protein
MLGFVVDLLKEPGLQSKLSKFLNRYNLQLLRLKDLNIADGKVIQHFLLDTPVSILTCGAPPLHTWWNVAFDDPEPILEVRTMEGR